MGSAAMNYTQVAMGGLDLYWYVTNPLVFFFLGPHALTPQGDRLLVRARTRYRVLTHHMPRTPVGRGMFAYARPVAAAI